MGNYVTDIQPFNQTPIQPVSAFLQGRAMQMAYQTDKLQQQHLEQQIADYPKQQAAQRALAMMQQQRLMADDEHKRQQDMGESLLAATRNALSSDNALGTAQQIAQSMGLPETAHPQDEQSAKEFLGKIEPELSIRFSKLGTDKQEAQYGPLETRVLNGVPTAGQFNRQTGEFNVKGREPAAIINANIASQAPASGGAVGMVMTGAPLNQVDPGFGRDAGLRRVKLRDAAIAQIKADNPGMDDRAAGEELAQRQVEYLAGKASITQLTKMLGASRQAIGQLEFNAEKTSEEMRKLPSTNLSPIINAIIRGEQKWTGNPAYAGLFFYMSASAVESARLISGGQASIAQLHQGAADEARKWASINMTPASWEEVKGAMLAEGQKRISTFEAAIEQGKPTSGRPGEQGQLPVLTPEEVRGAMKAGKSGMKYRTTDGRDGVVP